MKKFRLLGLILTLCMCFAIAMPAWAAVDSTAQIGGSTVHQMLPYPPELPSEKDTIKPYGTEPSLKMECIVVASDFLLDLYIQTIVFIQQICTGVKLYVVERSPIFLFIWVIIV